MDQVERRGVLSQAVLLKRACVYSLRRGGCGQLKWAWSCKILARTYARIHSNPPLLNPGYGPATYDWANFFDHPFRQRALKGIKTMHHLTFTDTKPGHAIVKDSVDSPVKEIKLLQDDNWKPQATDLPPLIPPPWISLVLI